jgi:archaellum component FlaC
MDFSKAIAKIADIVIKINNFYKKVKALYNKYAEKINGWIDKLNELFKKLVDAINNAARQAIVWVEMEINKILKKISDAIKVVTDKINDLTKQIGEWYEKTITNIKINVIRVVFAKLGIEADKASIEALASAIPHPSFESLVPEIKIELKIPVTQGAVNIIDIPSEELEISKLPLL